MFLRCLHGKNINILFVQKKLLAETNFQLNYKNNSESENCSRVKITIVNWSAHVS